MKALILLMALGADQHTLPAAKNGGVVVGMCDGETSLEVKKAPKTRDEGQAVSDTLMAEWKKKNPNAKWDVAAAPAQPPPSKAADKAPEKAGTKPPPGNPEKQIEPNATKPQPPAGHTYGAFTQRDEAIWKASVDDIVAEGKAVFHDAKKLGGTVAISCDMCHPDAANTHPETYPKYQVQLGRVAVLRDMINWCIENPVRGTPMAEDDPRMKAMEAYIYASRRGVPLEYGKH